MRIRWLKLCVSLIVSLAAGFIGGFFTASAIPTWYATLAKPSWNPPNWLFGPVWTFLYILMGIALYLVWVSRHDKRAKKRAMSLFFVQLTLNMLWSIIFFGFQAPFLAFIEIAAMWFFILLTIFAFYRISRPAAYLMVPYICWVSFAAVLNYAIYLLNR
jgi:translocator protein